MTTAREHVANRAGGRCELCGVPPARHHYHHRRPRGMGGSKRRDTNTCCNLLWLCATCHLQVVEVQREKALRNGWLVYQGRDPAAHPVLLWDGWFYLTPDGARVPIIGSARAAPEDRPGRALGG